MSNLLKTEKKVAVISMLAEGSSIRAIERITGVNQNTIMSLGRRVGEACAKIMDEKMRGLACKQIEVDEIWDADLEVDKPVNHELFSLRH